MIVLSKKRIVFIVTSVFLSIFIFFFSTSRRRKQNYIHCKFTKLRKDSYYRCPGIGVPDEGAESSNGTTEAESNLKIALKLQNLLEQSGTTVILTRSDENAIYDIDSKTLRQKKISDIHNRVKIGNESQADIFVSIHLNKIPENKYNGWQTFYKEGNEKSAKLANLIQNSLNETISRENNRTAKTIDNIYIIKHIEIPTTIVECGFLSNPEEEKLLLEDEYQNKLAWGIYNGIINYFYQ